MPKNNIALLAGVLLATTALTLPAQAADDAKGFQAGDIMLRVRGTGVVPEVSTNSVAPGSIGGTVNASNTIIPEVDASYFFTPHIAAELIAATTQHHMTLKNSALGASADLGKVWLLPPTLTAQYHFLPTSTVNPYVGAGLNYTLFYGQSGGLGGTHVSYKNNWGEVLQVGADIHVSGNWYANVDFKQIFLDTTANVSNSTAIADVSLNPSLFSIGIGYKF